MAVLSPIKSLFLQFYYDLSDRELENRLRDDLAFRWFCNISLDNETPDHTFFSRIRTTLGTKRIGQVFKNIMQTCGGFIAKPKKRELSEKYSYL